MLLVLFSALTIALCLVSVYRPKLANQQLPNRNREIDARATYSTNPPSTIHQTAYPFTIHLNHPTQLTGTRTIPTSRSPKPLADGTDIAICHPHSPISNPIGSNVQGNLQSPVSPKIDIPNLKFKEPLAEDAMSQFGSSRPIRLFSPGSL